MSTLPPAGTVCCLLCRGVVAYRNLDMNRFLEHIIIILINIILLRFQAHMNHEHGAYFDMDFLLAACLLDDKERKAVRNTMDLEHKAQQEKAGRRSGKRGVKKMPFSFPFHDYQLKLCALTAPHIDHI